MKIYRNNLKLVLQDDGQHTISIRVSDNTVDTYIVDDGWLMALADSWQDQSGAAWNSDSVDWSMQVSDVNLPSEYVRISAWPKTTAGCGRDYRVGRADLIEILDQIQPSISKPKLG